MQQEFTIVDGINEKTIVDKLIEGKVIARYSGRMEFGVRSLGNRSIIADPSYDGMVRKINQKIKYRDFWMPFCPTILHERQQDYIVNPKNLLSHYMTMSFDVTDRGKKEIFEAVHVGDYTTRPQILKKEDNPSHYNIIKEFEKRTGIGTLLNTSFNLHGDPIVCSPKDAIYTFLQSDIDALVMNDIMVSRGL